MEEEIVQKHERVTITDIAEALGISKTTVSRAISGKGRIGQETRKKVLDYIEKANYKPNPMAKGLADNKTYNICWVMPGENTATDLLFFQRCMVGIVEASIAEGYDVLITMIYEDNISQLRRVVDNKKVDGVILGRTLVRDEATKFLKNAKVPFVVIGSTYEEDVIQVDNDHVKACKELTSILVMKGIKKFAFIGGDTGHVVNQTRQNGFELALKNAGMTIDKELVFLNNIEADDVERSVDAALREGADCLMCTDDRICDVALTKLHREGLSIPEDIKVASFYNSAILETNQPAITAIQYAPKELGAVSSKILFKLINGEEVAKKTVLGYEVLLRGSTQ